MTPLRILCRLATAAMLVAALASGASAGTGNCTLVKKPFKFFKPGDTVRAKVQYYCNRQGSFVTGDRVEISVRGEPSTSSIDPNKTRSVEPGSDDITTVEIKLRRRTTEGEYKISIGGEGNSCQEYDESSCKFKIFVEEDDN